MIVKCTLFKYYIEEVVFFFLTLITLVIKTFVLTEYRIFKLCIQKNLMWLTQGIHKQKITKKKEYTLALLCIAHNEYKGR